MTQTVNVFYSFITNKGEWHSVIVWIDLMLIILKGDPGEIESNQMIDERIIVQLQKVWKHLNGMIAADGISL